MSAKFSGEWTQDNQSLISKLEQLKLLVEKEFDIDISIDKMLAELSYRELVISELNQLAHIEVTDIITWLTISENKAVALEETKQSSTLKPSYLALMLTFLLVLAGSFYWFTKVNITEPQQNPAIIKVANKPVEKIDNITASERLSTEAQKTNAKAKKHNNE
jgi:phosphate transport system substrate-binding protein